MKCPVCGTDNESGFKFCVKCGCNLENPQEVNYEQVDMGGYHTEEEFSSDKSSFRISGGTFTINDRAPAHEASELFTSDELNESDEEFDFSSFDEPFVPTIDTDRVSLPKNVTNQPQPMNMQVGMYGYQQPVNPAAMQQGMNGWQQNLQQQNLQQGQQMGGMAVNPYMNQMYGGQPVMAPQIMGYDQNGMPVYAPQPMMYQQPQFMGYDQNGMPVYAPQPMMYQQPPQQNSGEAGQNPYQQQGQFINPIQGMPNGINPVQNNMQSMQPSGMAGGQQQLSQQKTEEKKQKSKKQEDFWEFFDGGKDGSKKQEESADDFFGKSSRSGEDMGDLSTAGLDMSRLKKREKRKNSYMGDTPLVEAENLSRNESSKFNKLYMRQTATVNADDLEEKSREKTQDIMGVTKNVNASDLSANTRYKSRINMQGTGNVNADDLEAYTPERKKAFMAEADHAVEALPKKREYVDELDKIELPPEMQAKKTVRNNTPEIPGIPVV